jgi:hypothetical protein
MFEVISSKNEIVKYQEIFHALLRQRLPETMQITIGYQGESYRHAASTDGRFWHIFDITGNNGWSCFGFDPNPTGPNNIWAQVSLSQVGINRHIGGCLGNDRETGRVCLLHRGKIGGGRPGIGKQAFMDWLKHSAPERFRMVQDGDRQAQMIWVANLDEATMMPDLQAFVKLVWEFKESNVIKKE